MEKEFLKKEIILPKPINIENKKKHFMFKYMMMDILLIKKKGITKQTFEHSEKVRKDTAQNQIEK